MANKEFLTCVTCPGQLHLWTMTKQTNLYLSSFLFWYLKLSIIETIDVVQILVYILTDNSNSASLTSLVSPLALTNKPKNWEWNMHICISQLIHASACEKDTKRGVRVAWGTAECNSSLLSALQTSQVLNILTYAQLTHELIIVL